MLCHSSARSRCPHWLTLKSADHGATVRIRQRNRIPAQTDVIRPGPNEPRHSITFAPVAEGAKTRAPKTAAASTVDRRESIWSGSLGTCAHGRGGRVAASAVAFSIMLKKSRARGGAVASSKKGRRVDVRPSATPSQKGDSRVKASPSEMDRQFEFCKLIKRLGFAAKND